MKLDGRALADKILKDASSLRIRYNLPILRLAAVSGDPSAPTLSYLRIKRAQAIKVGIEMDIVEVSENHTTHNIIDQILEISDSYDAVIVQLPLPVSVETHSILNAIPQDKDADVLSQITRASILFDEKTALLPPVADAVREILLQNHIVVAGMKAAVLGKGWLVGEPVAAWLVREGAQVTIFTSESHQEDINAALLEADIVVSGVGKSGLITPDQIKEGVILIDAGTSESDGAIVGDIDPACAEKASLFTPVPGGVGPVAVACLMRNVVLLAERNAKTSV